MGVGRDNPPLSNQPRIRGQHFARLVLREQGWPGEHDGPPRALFYLEEPQPVGVVSSSYGSAKRQAL
jgi:hypothetical protein